MKINRTKLLTATTVKIFETLLNSTINDIDNNNSVNGIVDIKYSMALIGEYSYYSALILYNTNEPLETT